MLILADKPKWITSFDVIRVLRRVLREKKIWHSGTLDPMATGILLLGTGPDTKKLADLQKLSKTYSATINFAKMSDTWDMDYWKEFQEFDFTDNWVTKDGKEIPAPSQSSIEEKLQSLIPLYELPLTPFSAKKKDGKKLYELAREWNLIYETREMKVQGFKVISYNFPELKLELYVGSWTYIRSIAYRLGQQFWLGGVLTILRRTKVGDFDIKKIPHFEIAVGYFDDKEFDIRYAKLQ